MLVDIFITTKSRPQLLRKSLQSLSDCTQKHLYRLTVVWDGHDGQMDSQTWNVLREFDAIIDHTLIHSENLGLGPSINQALIHIDTLNRWYSEFPFHTAAAVDNCTEFICYCQDDLLYSPGWLERLFKMFMFHEKIHKLGFASGVECVEHEVKAT